jgi:hypothetical protein
MQMNREGKQGSISKALGEENKKKRRRQDRVPEPEQGSHVGTPQGTLRSRSSKGRTRATGRDEWTPHHLGTLIFFAPRLIPLPRRHPERKRSQAFTIYRRAVERGILRHTTYSGIFPCFFGGFLSRLFSSMASAWISFFRVSRGWMMASTNPRSAATYGLAKRSRNSSIFF